jgi:hypothetical protein
VLEGTLDGFGRKGGPMPTIFHRALPHPALAVRSQHKFQQVHHVVVVDPPGYLFQEQVMPDPIKVAAKIR